MESNSDSRAIVPFRHRHDGWTPERQEQFLARLQGTGCVAEACKAVGLSTTSAYRAFHRMPDFAMHWNRALSARRPMLEDAAFERAVRGAVVPLTRLGKVVGQRRHYSDGLLRFLIERADRQEAAQAKAPPVVEAPASREEASDMLRKRLDQLAQFERTRKREEMLDWAGRMEKAGWAP